MTEFVSVLTAPPHKPVVKTNRRSAAARLNAANSVYPDVVADSLTNLSAYYSPETFIKTCLFLVQSDNMFGQDDKRPMLFQIFWTSVQYVTAWVKPRLTVRGYPLLQNPNMSEGWYLMPPDFAGWVTEPTPLFYDFDKFGNWSFAFGSSLGYINSVISQDNGTATLKYHQIPPLNGLDSAFTMALRWHFLNELKLAQNSIAQYAQVIEANYQKYITQLKTSKNSEKTNQSSPHGNKGVGYLGVVK